MSGIGDLFGGTPPEKKDPAHSRQLPDFDVKALFEKQDAEAHDAPSGAVRRRREGVASFYEVAGRPADDVAGAGGESETVALPASVPAPSDDEFDRLLAPRSDTLPARRAAAALDTVAIDGPVHAGRHVGELGPDPVVAMSGPGPRRGLRRGQWIAIVSAVVAVVLIAGAVTLGFLLNAKPSTVEAVQRLESSERSIATRIDRVNADIDALATALETSTATAESFAPPLERIAGASDDHARTTAEQARQAYATALQEIVVPERVAGHERNDIDTEVLAEVEAEQAVVERRAVELGRLAGDVTSARLALTDVDEAFRSAVATFLGTVPAFADTVVVEGLDAEEHFRTAVVETAQTVATSDAFAPDAFVAWDGYIAAVAALRADQQRAVDEAEEDDNYYYVPPVVEPEPEPEPEPVEPEPDPGAGDEAPPAEE